MSQSYPKSSKELNHIALELQKESNRIKYAGYFILLLGFILTISFFLFMQNLTTEIFDRIQAMHKEILTAKEQHTFDDLTSLIFFLGIRTLVFGIVGGYLLFYVFKFGKSCFDQSTRFIKRKHATEFLDYISHKENDLSEQMKAFHIWNLTVESAFTDKPGESYRYPFFLKNIFGAEANKDGTTLKAEV